MDKDSWQNKQKELYAKLHALFFDKPENKQSGPVYLCGTYGKSTSDPLLMPEQWANECFESLQNEKHDACYGQILCPQCVEYGVYGVHFTDKVLGAHVFFSSGQWHCDYLPQSVGRLQMPDVACDETVKLCVRAAGAFMEKVRALADFRGVAIDDVTLPYFGLPTFASALNVALNLYGQEFLLALAEDEDAAVSDLRVINKTIAALHQIIMETVPLPRLQPVVAFNRFQPAGFGQICGCSTQLISAEMYGRLIAPLDEALLSVYPNGGMIHLCGAHLQHLETFKSMRSLRAVQLNDRAAADFEQYYKGLRDDQILYLNPCGEMPLNKALEISVGKRLVAALPLPQIPKR